MAAIPALNNAASKADLEAKTAAKAGERGAEKYGRSQEKTDLTPAATASEQRRKAYNASILQANYEANLSVKNEPQALVYKAAIEAINKELEGELGDNAIQKGYEQGLDVSPEATADRIVRFSTSLFGLYQQSNPRLSEEEQIERFIEVISGGVDQGFGEAREILDGLGVLEGEIAENIDKTYDLVQQGLAEFKEMIQAKIAQQTTDAAVE